MNAQPRHTPLEDAQGLACGVLMCALSLVLLREAGLVTGQTAGLALVLSYWSGLDLSLAFLAVNAPFYLLALLRVSWRFALKTLAAVALLSALVRWGAPFVTVAPTHPAAAATLAGVAAGFGLLALFRHGASLGGGGVLAFWLQDATGFRAGWTQMIFDAVVFALAATILDWERLGWSALGAVILNLLIAVNHRRDHYVAL